MKTILIFCSLFFFLQLNAQRKSFYGYFIAVSGDSIKGIFPNYTQWNRTPSKVQFLPDSQSNKISLIPTNCLKFLVEDYEEYVAFTGTRLANSIDDDLVMDNQMFWTADDEDSTVSTFLRVIIKSTSCEILVLNDGIRTNFFYRMPGQAIQEFRFKKKFINETRTVVYMDEYKDQIKKLFGHEIANKNLGKELENLAYREESFYDFFKKLFSNPLEVQQLKKKTGSLNINAGISLNTFSVNGDLYARARNFANSISPFVAIGYLMPFKRNFGRSFLYPQLRIYSFENSGTANTGTSERTSTFKSGVILLPELNGGVNIVNQKSIQFFVYAGIGIMVMIDGKEVYENKSSSGYLYTNETELSKLTGSTNFSTGLRFKSKFSVFITYVLPTSVSNYQNYTPKHSSMQFGLCYRFR